MDFDAAFNTYEDLVWVWINCDDDAAEEACKEYLSSTREIEHYQLSEINTWGKTHLESYDIKDKEDFEEMQKKLEEGIVAVHDPKIDKFLIIDGNHRVNTYAHHLPRKRIKVCIIEAPVFYGMNWVDRHKEDAS